MNADLERLRRAIHPEIQMNVVEQCEIVARGLADPEYFRNQLKLANDLGISTNQLYKMSRMHEQLTPEMKEWLKVQKIKDYKVNTYYKLSTLPPEDQAKFLQLEDADKRKFLSYFRLMFLSPREVQGIKDHHERDEAEVPLPNLPSLNALREKLKNLF